MPIVTLTTDFGLKDPYVGQVKGVILTHCREAVLVDLTHQVPPQHVLRAAHILADSAPYFPEGTIHLAVVDPGVGTARRAIVVRAEQQLFVAPDNGLLTPIIKRNPEAKIWQVTGAKYVSRKISPTFHGRDVFAPVAGWLAAGLAPAELGPRIDDPVLLDWPEPFLASGRLKGLVLFVDRFGNLVTNIPATMILGVSGGEPPTVIIGDRRLKGIHLTYAEKEAGEPLALIGSLDLLEIAVNRGRADLYFRCKEGDPVEVEL